MATNRTFTMLKPDAVEKGHIGAILEKISASGFKIVAMKLTQMTTSDAQAFYAIHNERPFFTDLVEYMTRGPIEHEKVSFGGAPSCTHRVFGLRACGPGPSL